MNDVETRQEIAPPPNILAYMTPGGDFAITCAEGTPLPVEGLVEAPSGGAYGMRWTGSFWVNDETAYDRALAFCYPKFAILTEREKMRADKWQVVAALQILFPGRWENIIEYRNSEDCDPVTGALIDFAIDLPRVSESIDFFAYKMDLSAEDVDEVFRLAMSLRR